MRDDENDYLALDGMEDDPMLQIHGYSITYRIATGCAANVAGFSLHAGVMSNAQDRCKLERLCRYITRSGVS